MTLNDRQLQDLYQSATARAAGRRADCPASEILVGLAAGSLAPGSAGATTDHLAECSDCAAEYALLAPLQQWADGVTAPYERHDGATVHRRLWPAWSQALAAAAVLAVVGLSMVSVSQWRRGESLQSRLAVALRQAETERSAEREANTRRITDLNREISELSRPQVNVPIIDLEAAGPLRGPGSDATKTIEIARGTHFFNLVLYVSDSTMYESYEIEVTRDDALVWHGEGLRRSAYDTFTVALPARMLPAGVYHLRLLGRAAESRRTVQEYEIEIEHR